MDKIVFQDGTKISDGKITVDGQDYILTPAVYEGATPLSAYVMNKLQDNIEKAIDGTRLWYNENGNAGGVSLYEPAANYKRIKIIYGVGYVPTSSIIVEDVAATINYDRSIDIVCSAFSTTTNEYINIKHYNLRGNEITEESEHKIMFPGGSFETFTYDQAIRIFEVIGYN